MEERLYDLSGDVFPNDVINWTPQDFIEYYTAKYGIMNLDEFDDLNMKIISEMFPEVEGLSNA